MSYDTQELRLPMNEFLRQIGQLPAVRQMVADELEAQTAEQAAARSACLADLRTLQKQAADAHAAKTFAESVYQQKLLELEPLRLRMLDTASAHGDASRQVCAVARDLHIQFGENHVTHAMAVIGGRQAAALKTIQRLEQVSSDRTTPEVTRMLERTKAELSQISEALEQVQKLAFADGVSPSQLQSQTAQLLKAVGHNPDAVAADGHLA